MLKSPLNEAAARRTIAESRVIDMLLVRIWPVELRGEGRATAEAEARTALDGLVALGLPCERGAGDERRFDVVEVLNFVMWAGDSYGDRTFTQNVASARRLVRELYPPGEDGDGHTAPPLAALGPRRYTVTLRRRFNLNGYEPGRRMRLRLPLPLEDASLGDLDVEFLPPAGLAVETSAGPGRLDVIAPVPPSGEITAAVRTRFTARSTVSASAPALDPDERALYLRPDEGLVRSTERIAALAHRLAGDAPSAADTLERFWEFFLSDLGCGYIHYDLLDPAKPLDTVLDWGWTDCRLGSALLAALCRARGIPARIVSGYLLYPSAPGYHTWFEAWVDGKGWRALDLYGWGMTEDRSRKDAWREYFHGQVDHRMVTERPPLLFGTTGSVRLPRAWDMLYYAQGKGSVMEFNQAGTDELVYSEYVEVEAVSDPE